LVFAMFPGPIDYDAAMTVGALVLVALAAREDIVRNRVSNNLNGAALLTALLLGVTAGGAEGLVNSAGGALAGCGALLPFYLLRGMGAGDVKLMAAAGAFLGPGAALLAAALSLIAGGVLALAYVAWRLVQPRAGGPASLVIGHALPSGTAAAISIVRKERFPYAVAIAAGVAVTLFLEGSLGNLYSALGLG
jgi:prepilin peptidase CpaA